MFENTDSGDRVGFIMCTLLLDVLLLLIFTIVMEHASPYFGLAYIPVSLVVNLVTSCIFVKSNIDRITRVQAVKIILFTTMWQLTIPYWICVGIKKAVEPIVDVTNFIIGVKND